MPGELFVIATPLGNLEDLSPRAVETLRRADCILCEDTRKTNRLLSRHGITSAKLSYHRFNERERLAPILRRLGEGQILALVSDGGTPGISDPGSILVRAALEAGFEVSPIPGPSAVTALLSVSGFTADRYVFEGFLPHRPGERRRRLRGLREERRTLVFFEAPHRIVQTLQDIEEIFGRRDLVLGRELTKRFETILRGCAGEVALELGGDVKGEITLAVAGASDITDRERGEPRAERIKKLWHLALAEAAGDRRSALRSASRALGMKRAELYRHLVELGEDPDRSSR